MVRHTTEANIVFIAYTDLDVRRAEEYPERQMKMSQIIAALPKVPVSPCSTSGSLFVKILITLLSR
jgi:hypothetical protein